MLKPLPELINQYNLNISGVIHIGGHHGQEYPLYKQCNIKNIAFVEPHPYNVEILKSNVGNECLIFNTALGNQEGTIEMFIEEANQGQSSSVLEPYVHLQQYPHIEFLYKIDVPITKLDLLDLDKSKFNMINIDVQGYELEVFKGGQEFLKTTDYIYTEVNRDEVYKNCAKIEDLNNFLSPLGFQLKDVWWVGGSWGDAFLQKVGK